jgi:hypothetical protein
MIDFTERMDEGRRLAVLRRNECGGSPFRTVKNGLRRRAPTSELDRLEHYWHEWHKDWQWQAYAAVEWALFGDDLKELGF